VEKGARFCARKYDLKKCVSTALECGDFVVQIHKRSECGVSTLPFLEEANIFAVGEQKEIKGYFHTRTIVFI